MQVKLCDLRILAGKRKRIVPRLPRAPPNPFPPFSPVQPLPAVQPLACPVLQFFPRVCPAHVIELFRARLARAVLFLRTGALKRKPAMTLDPVLQTVGNYELLEKIAEGGMGAIYKGRHRTTGQIVALKVMPPGMAHNKVLLKRFEQEFRAASR